MKASSLDLLACPACRDPLLLTPDPDPGGASGRLQCTACQAVYPIRQGIVHFLEADSLSGSNRRFARTYNRLSWIYRLFSRLAFAYIGMDEATGRREITDRLDPRGGRVLEVSIGPGVNLPYLIGRQDVGEVLGLDISLGQLLRCREFLAKQGWQVDLFLGSGEQLPFLDNSFAGVFHVGGINFFNDRQAAIDEMIRVAEPGARILIADETERGARGYERTIPGFKRSFAGSRPVIVPPIDLVPKGMLERRVFEVWKGWMYCLEFRKPG